MHSSALTLGVLRRHLTARVSGDREFSQQSSATAAFLCLTLHPTPHLSPDLSTPAAARCDFFFFVSGARTCRTSAAALHAARPLPKARERSAQRGRS